MIPGDFKAPLEIWQPSIWDWKESPYYAPCTPPQEVLQKLRDSWEQNRVQSGVETEEGRMDRNEGFFLLISHQTLVPWAVFYFPKGPVMSPNYRIL